MQLAHRVQSLGALRSTAEPRSPSTRKKPNLASRLFNPQFRCSAAGDFSCFAIVLAVSNLRFRCSNTETAKTMTTCEPRTRGTRLNERAKRHPLHFTSFDTTGYVYPMKYSRCYSALSPHTSEASCEYRRACQSSCRVERLVNPLLVHSRDYCSAKQIRRYSLFGSLFPGTCHLSLSRDAISALKIIGDTHLPMFLCVSNIASVPETGQNSPFVFDERSNDYPLVPYPCRR